VAATTAVVAGTAGAVRHRQDQRYDQKAAEQQQAEQAAMYQQQAAADQAAAQAAAAQQAAAAGQQAGPGPRLDEQLREIAELHQSGVLTDEEFVSAKAQLLGKG